MKLSSRLSPFTQTEIYVFSDVWASRGELNLGWSSLLALIKANWKVFHFVLISKRPNYFPVISVERSVDASSACLSLIVIALSLKGKLQGKHLSFKYRAIEIRRTMAGNKFLCRERIPTIITGFPTKAVRSCSDMMVFASPTAPYILYINCSIC